MLLAQHIKTQKNTYMYYIVGEGTTYLSPLYHFREEIIFWLVSLVCLSRESGVHVLPRQRYLLASTVSGS